MSKNWERIGKIVAAGLAVGIGASACSETAPVQSPSAGSEMAKLTAEAAQLIQKHGLDVSPGAILPNGEVAQLNIFTEQQCREVTTPAHAEPKRLTPADICDIDISIDSSGSRHDTKEFTSKSWIDFQKSSDGKWTTTSGNTIKGNPDNVSETSPLSYKIVGEVSESFEHSYVQTYSSLANKPTVRDEHTIGNHNAANRLLTEQVNRAETYIHDIARYGGPAS